MCRATWGGGNGCANIPDHWPPLESVSRQPGSLRRKVRMGLEKGNPWASRFPRRRRTRPERINKERSSLLNTWKEVGGGLCRRGTLGMRRFWTQAVTPDPGGRGDRAATRTRRV